MHEDLHKHREEILAAHTVGKQCFCRTFQIVRVEKGDHLRHGPSPHLLGSRERSGQATRKLSGRRRGKAKNMDVRRLRQPMISRQQVKILSSQISSRHYRSPARGKRICIPHRLRTGALKQLRAPLQRLPVALEEHDVANAIQQNAGVLRHTEAGEIEVPIVLDSDLDKTLEM